MKEEIRKLLFVIFVILFWAAAAYLGVNYVLPGMIQRNAQTFSYWLARDVPLVMMIPPQIVLIVLGPAIIVVHAILAILANLFWLAISPRNLTWRWVGVVFVGSGLLPIFSPLISLATATVCGLWRTNSRGGEDED